jgi:hypothetical protein
MNHDTRKVLATDENGRPILWRDKDMDALGWEGDGAQLAIVAAKAIAENKALREDVIQYASGVFFEIATKDDDGWYCTNARGTAIDAGDKLVALGVMETDPKRGYGRVQYYRPVRSDQGKG